MKTLLQKQNSHQNFGALQIEFNLSILDALLILTSAAVTVVKIKNFWISKFIFNVLYSTKST